MTPLVIVALIGACVVLAGRAMTARSADDARERAGLPRSPRERRVLRSSVPAWDGRPARFALAGAAALTGWLLVGPAGAVGCVLATLVLPSYLRRRIRAKQLASLEDELADAVSAMSAGVRAGLSLSQAMEYAAKESAPPLGPSLGEVVDRATLGQPLGESLDEWAAGSDLPDIRLITGVLALHRRSGGDLPTVLDRLAETLRERRASAGEVRSLTAQARLSGAILGFLPIGFFCFLSITSRGDVQAALSEPAGVTAIVSGLVMQAAAFLWIRSLLRVT